MANKTFNIPASGAKIPLVIDPVPYAGATLKYTAPAWITPSSGEITITGSDTGERGYYQVLTASTNTTQSSRSGVINISGKTAQDPSYQGIAEGYSSITVSQSVGAAGVIMGVGLKITESSGTPSQYSIEVAFSQPVNWGSYSATCSAYTTVGNITGSHIHQGTSDTFSFGQGRVKDGDEFYYLIQNFTGYNFKIYMRYEDTVPTPDPSEYLDFNDHTGRGFSAHAVYGNKLYIFILN